MICETLPSYQKAAKQRRVDIYNHNTIAEFDDIESLVSDECRHCGINQAFDNNEGQYSTFHFFPFSLVDMLMNKKKLFD